MEVVATVERVLRDRLRPTKVNLASLGNVVPHLHWHVIARFDWDGYFPQSIWAARQREPNAGRKVGFGMQGFHDGEQCRTTALNAVVIGRIAKNRMVIEKNAAHAGLAREHVHCLKLFAILLERVRIPRLGGIQFPATGDRRIKHDQLQIVGQWDRIGRGEVGDVVIGGLVATAYFLKRPWVEKTKPALPCASAFFVIAARHRPRGG